MKETMMHSVRPSALYATVEQQIAASRMVPECAQALRQIAYADSQWQERETRWGWLIPELQRILGDTAQVARPFAEAWYLLNAATVRLDHVQDGDPSADPLPFDQPALQYQLLLSYYVLAQGVLDRLDTAMVPNERVTALRQLWSRMVLRAASGQLRDLLAGTHAPPADPMTYYQELAQAKSGAIFALAFGGTATLLSDDPTVRESLTLFGESFGTLLQYNDDIADRASQPNTTLTLPLVYTTALGTLPPTRSLAHYWTYVYQTYRAHLDALMCSLPVDYHAPLRAIIERVFQAQPEAAPV
jgi:hypothetical protein